MSSKTRNNCEGGLFPSGCVVYTGVLPEFISSDSIDCKGKLDPIIKLFGEAINTILTGADLSEIEENCFDFNLKTLSISRLNQEKLIKICEQEEAINHIQAQLESLEIGNRKIKIDLSCLVSTADPCDNAGYYTLAQIFRVFKNEICRIKEIFIKCCQNQVAGTSGTSGVSTTSGTSGTSGILGSSGTSGTNGTSGIDGTSGATIVYSNEYRYGTTELLLCAMSGGVTLYSFVPFANGTVLYIDSGLTTPLTGQNFVAYLPGTELFVINSVTGQVGASTGNGC